MAVDDRRPSAAGDTDRVSTVDDLADLEAALAAAPPSVAPLAPRPERAPADAVDPELGPPVPEGRAASPVLTALAEVADDDRAGRARYDCPGCGAQWLARRDSGPRASAAAFCPDCDFPLFWSAEGAAAKRRSHEAARRRHPGVDGREALARIDCRVCGEPNLPDPGADCVRCGSSLTPPPPEPAPPEPVTVFVEVPVPPRRWQIATAVSSTLLLASVVALWVVVFG